MAPRETENNAYAKFWGDKQRALWYAMVISVVVNWTARQSNRAVQNSNDSVSTTTTKKANAN